MRCSYLNGTYLSAATTMMVLLAAHPRSSSNLRLVNLAWRCPLLRLLKGMRRGWTARRNASDPTWSAEEEDPKPLRRHQVTSQWQLHNVSLNHAICHYFSKAKAASLYVMLRHHSTMGYFLYSRRGWGNFYHNSRKKFWQILSRGENPIYLRKNTDGFMSPIGQVKFPKNFNTAPQIL